MRNTKRQWELRPCQTYTLSFPFHGSIADTTRVQVGRTAFRTGSLENFIGSPNWSLIDVTSHEQKRVLGENRSKFVLLETEASGADSYEAMLAANLDFDLLRASANLLLVGRRFHQQFGQIKPIGKCLPPPLVLATDTDGHLVGTFRSVLHYDYGSAGFPVEASAQLEAFLRDLDSASGEIRELLRASVLRFGEAADSVDWSMTFLMLWQVLESVTLQERGTITMDRVAARICHLNRAEGLMPEVIGTVRDIRNDLVHRGWFRNDSLDHVNLANLVAFHTIIRLVNLSAHIHTKNQLEQYYACSASSVEDLKERRAMVDLVLSERRQASIEDEQEPEAHERTS